MLTRARLKYGVYRKAPRLVSYISSHQRLLGQPSTYRSHGAWTNRWQSRGEK